MPRKKTHFGIQITQLQDEIIQLQNDNQVLLNLNNQIVVEALEAEQKLNLVLDELNKEQTENVELKATLEKCITEKEEETGKKTILYNLICDIYDECPQEVKDTIKKKSEELDQDFCDAFHTSFGVKVSPVLGQNRVNILKNVLSREEFLGSAFVIKENGKDLINRKPKKIIILKFWTFSGNHCPTIHIVGVRKIDTHHDGDWNTVGRQYEYYELVYFDEDFQEIYLDNIPLSGCGKIDKTGKKVTGYKIIPMNAAIANRLRSMYDFIPDMYVIHNP